MPVMCVIMAFVLCANAGSTVATRAGISWEVSQFVRSSNARSGSPTDTTWLNGYWVQRISTVFRIDARAGDRLSGYIEYYGSILFTLPDEGSDRSNQVRQGIGTMRAACIEYVLSEDAFPDAGFRAGYFPFDYAPENRIIGEYLLKTGTYPGYVISEEDDWPVLGMHAFVRFPRILRHDIIVNIEMEQRPQGDLSFAYLARLGRGRVFELDAGVVLHRVLRSRQAASAQVNGFERWPIREPVYDSRGDRSAWDTTGWYQKAGTKVLGRAVFDPKKLMPFDRLGPEDLKLYAEACVLGVKDYDGYYDDITERVPGMVGVNLPAFGLLDVLSVEAEYYGSLWKNNPCGDGRPVPDESFEYQTTATGSIAGFRTIEHPSEGAGRKARTDNIKWSAYAMKTISDRLSVSARVASDHFRPGREAGAAPVERIHAPGEFYWSVRVETVF
ncbi:MAG: hypothetical protein GF410_09425 [Chitinivibrionales bacterium]|nr:hypothetical protein [Chitinivibrionales bacterium]